MNDAPDIRSALETGYPREVKWPRCPACGSECNNFYKDQNGDVFGCECCVEIADAWEETDE